MIVTETEVIQAMAHWEKMHVQKHGPLDRVNMPEKCSKLADLLGTMWFNKETQATISDAGEMAELIKAAK